MGMCGEWGLPQDTHGVAAAPSPQLSGRSSQVWSSQAERSNPTPVLEAARPQALWCLVPELRAEQPSVDWSPSEALAESG